MENSFWNINEDTGTSFVERFKKSFTLYVDSGMKEKTERGIEVLINERGEFSPHWQPEAKNFDEKFYKFIFDRYLRKFHCFYLYSTHLINISRTKCSPLGIPGQWHWQRGSSICIGANDQRKFYLASC